MLEPGAVAISVMDGITVTESNINVVQPFPPIQVSDTVTVIEQITAVTPTVLYVNVSDTTTVADTVTPTDVEIVIPPAFHEISVYEVSVVTESHVVDRDIWGPKDDEETGWEDAPEGEPPIYTEIPDPETDWRDADTHER